MVFVCPNCSSKYRIPDERFKRDSVRVKCRKCELISTVHRSGRTEAASGPKTGSTVTLEAAKRPVARPATQAPKPAAASPRAPAQAQAQSRSRAAAAARKPRLSEHWYYLDGRERKGPAHFADLDKYCAAGVIHDKTYVWHPTFDGWKKIGEVKILRPLLERRQAPKPPPIPQDVAPSAKGDGGRQELLADLRSKSPRKEARPSGEPSHRSGDLMDFIDKIEPGKAARVSSDTQRARAFEEELTEVSRTTPVVDAAAKPAAKPDPAAKAAPEAKAAKQDVADLLKKLDEAEQAELFDAHEQEFFAAKEESMVGEDLNQVLRQLAHESVEEEKKEKRAIQQAKQDGPDLMADIPDIQIPSESFIPSKAERRRMVQEFSMMIRHESKTRKVKLVVLVLLLVFAGGVAWGVKMLSEREAPKSVVYDDSRGKLGRVTYTSENTKKHESESEDEYSRRIARLKREAIARREEDERKARRTRRRERAVEAPAEPSMDEVEDEFAISKSFEFEMDKQKKAGGPKAGSIMKDSSGKSEVMIGFKSAAERQAAEDTFTEAGMTRVIKKKMKRFNTCKRYTVGMDQIEVKLHFTVGTSGRISNVSLEAEQVIPKELARCVRDEVAKWTFPRPESPKSYVRNLLLD